MKNTFKTKIKPLFTKKNFKENKKKSILLIIVFITIIYFIIKSLLPATDTNKYIVNPVSRGNIVTTVSASGQVSATNQVDLKTKNSGDITSINVYTGQEVKVGTNIAQVDARDAWYSYQAAKISYEKLIKPADTVSTIQAENGLDNAKNSLNTYYAEAISDIDNVFIDTPNIIEGLNTMYYSSNGTLNSMDEVSLSNIARSYKTQAGMSLDKVKRDFETNFSYYKTHNSQSDQNDTDILLSKTYDMVLAMTEAVKGTKQTLDYLQNTNIPAKNLSTSQANVNAWLITMNNHLNKLVSVKNNIAISKKNIIEKQASLTDVQSGADSLDIESARLSLAQKAAAYNDSFIKAPFDGVIAKVSVKKGDNISSGSSVATIITKQKIVTVDLNEVDISKVKIGQIANVTFDAIDGLIATGTVVSVDEVGSVTQGVVSYNVKVVLNTFDDRVLSGMSSSLIIETDTKTNAVAVPNAAIKTQGNMSYVEVIKDDSIKPGLPISIDKSQIEKRKVVLGLSDDNKTEIISGLEEGENIITKTIAINTVKKTSTAPSLFGGSSGGVRTGGMNGNTRSITK